MRAEFTKLTKAQAFQRAGGRCECGCGSKLTPGEIEYDQMIQAFRKAETPEAIEEQIFRYMHEAIPEDLRDIDHPDWTVEDVARWINR